MAACAVNHTVVNSIDNTSPLNDTLKKAPFKTMYEEVFKEGRIMVPVLYGAGHLYKRDGVDSRTFRDLQARLSKFVTTLKSYITKRAFDVVGFGKVVERLEQEYSDLSNGIQAERRKAFFEHSESTDEWSSMRKQHEFSQHLFHVMTYSVHMLKRLTKMNVPGTRFLYKVIEANVRVYAGYTIHGEADISSLSHSIEHLGELTRSLQYWKDRFEQLRDVPQDVKRIFYTRFDRAQGTIENLASHFRH